MTVMEFEGRTEREAVARAAAELGSESFDVEVLEKGGGLFGRGKVKIRVRPLTTVPDPMKNGSRFYTEEKIRPLPASTPERDEAEIPAEPPSTDVVEAVSSFVEGITERMDLPASVTYKEMDGTKAVFEITSESSNILIGKKGKNLDALQLLANVYLIKVAGDHAPLRVVLDTEGYRERREESLIRIAHRTADEAVRTRSNRLLEPMNPFERRLIHTAINDRDDVLTKSEGEGLYKRVRIIAKGRSQRRSRDRR